MKRNRVTPHRPQTEEKIKNKKLAEAKRELQALKKTVGRLQKQLKRALEQQGVPEEEEMPTKAAEPVSTQIHCPKCNSEIFAAVTLPTGIMYVCKDCGKRWKSQ